MFKLFFLFKAKTKAFLETYKHFKYVYTSDGFKAIKNQVLLKV